MEEIWRLSNFLRVLSATLTLGVNFRVARQTESAKGTIVGGDGQWKADLLPDIRVMRKIEFRIPQSENQHSVN